MHFTPAIVVGLVVCMGVGVIPAFRALLAQRPRPNGGAEGDDDGGQRRSRDPYLRPGPDEPAWWPEFEREFAGYVSLGDAARPSSD